MADIKQAAKWMEEGKRVVRPDFGDGYSLRIDSNGYLIACGPRSKRHAWLAAFDLLADDWEIAPQP